MWNVSQQADTRNIAKCAQKHTQTTQTSNLKNDNFLGGIEIYPPPGIPASQKANPQVISFLIHGFSWFLERSDIF